MLHSLPLCLSLFLLPGVFAASADEWKSRSIYQIITDRFATSDDSSVDCDASARKYCGGTWKGIQNHLDYIQNMGFDAIWISPVVENIDGETAYGEAYHGYWTKNINALNSKFGSEDDLRSLVSAVHDRNMYIMVDVVANHFANVPTSTGDTLPQTFDFSGNTPFSSQDNYHPQCFITDYNNQTEVELCWVGDASLPLPDLDTEDDSIVSTMNDWIKNLVSTYSLDGIRIDTVKHIRKDFWPNFASSAGVFTIGEVLSDSVSYTAEYTEVLDSVLDYPTWFAVMAAFNTTSGNMSGIQSAVEASQSAYKNGEFMTGSFLENHDQPRFQSLTQDNGLVKNAMTWPFIQDGIPILYYGQEQGYTGGNDPDNREALWFTAYQEDKDLVKLVKSLNEARKQATASNSNFLNTAVTFVSQTDQSAIAVSKPPLLALFTNKGSSAAPPTWNFDGVYGSDETLVDILTCEEIHGTDAQASAGEPRVLMPASALSKSGSLCTDLAQGTSSSGAIRAGASLVSVVVLVVVSLALVL